MENHRFISKSDSAKVRSNRKRIRQQKVHLNAQDSVHASVNPASSHTEDHYNQPKTPPHSVHATVNRASHDAENHCKLSKIQFLYLYIHLILIKYIDTISIYSLLCKIIAMHVIWLFHLNHYHDFLCLSSFFCFEVNVCHSSENESSGSFFHNKYVVW